MHDGLNAALEELLSEYTRQVEHVREAHAKLSQITATAVSADGTVTVTIGPQGRIDALLFHPRVYSRMSPTELSGMILDLIGEATRDVAQQTQDLMAPLVPEGLAFEEIFGANADVTSLLPQPRTRKST
ncbi:YbaB/EbfC family nucleoid-associated protein [Nonomuraea sp. NPDC049152]|uniref:YbaB/EbfC family nucleoid-associated protein n=1 Tax=Nonomuraea sp. NPDC049152 TaxID=3154350 RepID=UPI0033E0F2ED